MSDIAQAPATGTARFRFKNGTVPSQEALNEWLRTLLEDSGLAPFVDVVEEDAEPAPLKMELPRGYGSVDYRLAVTVGPDGGDDTEDEATLAALSGPGLRLRQLACHLIDVSETYHVVSVDLRRA